MIISEKQMSEKHSLNPELNLFVTLRRSRPILNKLIVILLRQKRFIINLDSTTHVSSTEITNRKNKRPIYKVNWGIAPDYLNTIDREIFDFNSFDNKSLKQYRVLQQLGICFYHELKLRNINTFNALINTVNNLYSQDKKFYTLYGGFYDSIEHTQTPENYDIAELIAIYFWDGNYFNKYFRFLISEDLKDLSIKKAFNIRSLTPTTAKIIEELLSSTFQKFNPQLAQLD